MHYLSVQTLAEFRTQQRPSRTQRHLVKQKNKKKNQPFQSQLFFVSSLLSNFPACTKEQITIDKGNCCFISNLACQRSATSKIFPKDGLKTSLNNTVSSHHCVLDPQIMTQVVSIQMESHGMELGQGFSRKHSELKKH